MIIFRLGIKMKETFFIYIPLFTKRRKKNYTTCGTN